MLRLLVRLIARSVIEIIKHCGTKPNLIFSNRFFYGPLGSLTAGFHKISCGPPILQKMYILLTLQYRHSVALRGVVQKNKTKPQKKRETKSQGRIHRQKLVEYLFYSWV